MKFTDGVLEIEEQIAHDVRKLIRYAADNCFADGPDGVHAARVRSLAREGDKLTIRRFEIPLLRGAATAFLVTGGHEAMELRDRVSSEVAYDLPAIGAGFNPAAMSHVSADTVLDNEAKNLADVARTANNILAVTESD